jgi:hypothetical protein
VGARGNAWRAAEAIEWQREGEGNLHDSCPAVETRVNYSPASAPACRLLRSAP